MKNHGISLVSALLTAQAAMGQSTPVASSASTTSTAFAWSTYPAEDLCSTTTTFLALATPWANPEEMSSKMNSKYITEEITGAITTAGELVVVATLTAVNGWGEPANGYYVFFESYLKSENFDIITSTETQTSMCSHSIAPSPTGKGDCTPHEDHWHCDGAAAEASGTQDPDLPPSPTASVGCHPHGDHWHCDGPATAATSDSETSGSPSASASLSETTAEASGAASATSVYSFLVAGVVLAVAALA